ncbi:MAG: hypothetical protein K1X53_09280 [Candidatus Sumerlaeaceae bacterium]|nr:hypothetical protein [Candidatus Sumerlaeaceae bacterium]
MKWSQLRHQVENRFADSIAGRVSIHNARYRTFWWGASRVWIEIDKTQVINMSWMTGGGEFDKEAHRLMNLKPTQRVPWTVPPHIETAVKTILASRSVFSNQDAVNAFQDFLMNPVENNLKSENPLLRALSMLDRKVGKRRLKSLNAKEEHPLVRQLYEFRCKAEGIGL